MPTPPQLLDGFASAHVDSATFALCQFVLFRHWRKKLGAAATSLRSDVTIRTVLITVVALVAVETLVPYSGTFSAWADFRWVVTRLGLFALAAVVNWQLIRHDRLRQSATGKLRAHLRSLHRARAMRLKAEAAGRAKNDFIASFAHELRTPLNAVIASADVIARGSNPDVQRGHARKIIKESTQLGKALNEALELRRVEDFTITLNSAPMDPEEIARELADLFGARASEKGLDIKVSTTVPPGLTVAGDARRYRQVLANLLDNAIKFSSRGTVQLGIDFTPAPNAQCLSLLTTSVKDGGIGLTVVQRTALLAGSMNHPTSAGLPAAGMGLAIAQRLVRLFGGEITARSRAGEGTEFAFTIPVSVLSTHPAVVLAHPPASTERRRVLIVDDVAANRILLQMFLEQQGYAADYAAGGADAIGLASRNRYDAVLMDLNMPDIDGVTAAQRIRAAERREARTVIVAVTAAADPETRAKCFTVGMDGYFVKPLDLHRFCADLADLIAARQAVQTR